MNEALIKELKRIFSDREMAEKISKLKEDEIFDFCLKNSGLEFTNEDFRAAVVDLLCMSDVGRRFLSEEELDLIAGGVGGNLKKSAATLMALLTLSGAPSFAADSGGMQAGATASVSLEVAWENFENLKKVDINGVEYVVLGEDLGENGEITQDYISKFGRDNLVNVIIADNVTKIGPAAFNECEKLKKVNAPKVEEIGGYTFRQCKGLEEVNFPEVKKIGFSAFNGCAKLKNVDSPKIEEIGEYAFCDCKSLEEVNLPEAKKISTGAFEECTNLKNVKIPKLEFEDDDDEDYYWTFMEACDNLQEVTVPNLKSFKIFSAWSCGNLKKIFLPKSAAQDNLDPASVGVPEGCEIVYLD